MSDRPDDALPTGRGLTAHDDRFREDPHAVYDALRSRAPLHHDASWGRWFVTRYAMADEVLRHKGFGVDVRKSLPDSYMRRVAGTGVAEGEGATAYEPPLVLLDDPAHRRIRLLMSKAFTPRAMEGMRGRIEAIAADSIAVLRGETEIDFIERYAGPLPTRVIGEMLGLPPEHCTDLKYWSDDILRGYDPERDAAAQRRLREGYVAMSGLFQAAVAERRRAPRSDLISDMVRAQEEVDRLTDLEIISLCVQLLVAGNVTTTDLMGNGLYALLAHPDQLASLRAAPELIDRAIEEILRYDCPLAETARIALADETLAGCPVRKGGTVTVSLAAANHDPARFREPHRFDITRDATGHLGFGSGVHVCLGAPLARLEGAIGLRAFIQAFPDVGPGSRPARRRHLPSFRGFETLPVRLGGMALA